MCPTCTSVLLHSVWHKHRTLGSQLSKEGQQPELRGMRSGFFIPEESEAALGVRRLKVKAVCPWASHSPTLSLTFLIYKLNRYFLNLFQFPDPMTYNIKGLELQCHGARLPLPSGFHLPSFPSQTFTAATQPRAPSAGLRDTQLEALYPPPSRSLNRCQARRLPSATRERDSKQ